MNIMHRKDSNEYERKIRIAVQIAVKNSISDRFQKRKKPLKTQCFQGFYDGCGGGI